MPIDTSIENRADFNILRYANCWEDTEVLIEALNITPESKCFSIASAGDNSLALLTQDPYSVLAIDLNPVQIACSELKKSAIKNLSYDNFLSFIGFKTSGVERLRIYKDKLLNDISEQSKNILNSNTDLINTGIIHTGKFEHYFQFFKKYILSIIHKKETVVELFNDRPEEDRISFYNDKWNNLRWRFLFKIFFSRFTMGHLGRDPEFFKYVEGNVATRILERTEYAFTRIPTCNNSYLNYIMLNNYDIALPFYAQEPNFNSIKNNIEKLTFFTGSIDQAIDKHNIKFDRFNLSDIFEYMNPE